MRLTVPALGLALSVVAAAAPARSQDVGTGGHVAELARGALARPGDPGAWAALADALPELAVTGGASLEETFEAARLADSLAAAVRPVPAAVGGVPLGASGREAAMRAAAPGPEAVLDPPAAEPTGRGPYAGGLLAGLLLLPVASLAALRRRRGGSGEAHPLAPASRAPRRRPARGGRAWALRALARDGADVGEVARRAGMTREGVALALRLARRRAA